MNHIKTLILKTYLIVAVLLVGFEAHSENATFKFYLPTLPHSFDPAQLYGAETSYLLRNLLRGLYRYDNKNGVIPEGAKKCEWKVLELHCELDPTVRWSDGQQVIADDYVRAFRHLVDPKSKSRENAHLLRLKYAKQILSGKIKPEKLGVKSTSKHKLVFEFQEKDPQFIERLTATALVPWRNLPDLKSASSLITNGPYKIKSLSNTKAYLVPNEHYQKGNPDRPDVEIFYVDESATAQNLFDTGKINLLHQVNTAFIPKLKDKEGFFQVTFSRFDYVGFGKQFKSDKNLRKALSLALNYDQLTKIMFAVGRFGCAGLTRNYISKDICYPYDLKEARRALAKVPKDLLEQKFVFKFSRAGGDNLARIAEWYQNQWKKNLGIDIHLESIEQGMYLQELSHDAPALFRKGTIMDRPTCLSVLESFQKDNPDNYIKYHNKKFEGILENLADSKSKKESIPLCENAIQILMEDYAIIPQGLIHFTMLKDDKFEGFEFNELNQLDLSNLRKIK